MRRADLYGNCDSSEKKDMQEKRSIEALGDHVRSCQADWEAVCPKEQAQISEWQSAVRKKENQTQASICFLLATEEYDWAKKGLMDQKI